jgi:hypothetical protein
LTPCYISQTREKAPDFHLPKAFVNLELLQQYTIDRCVSYSTVRDSLILSIYCADESNTGWIDGEGWLSRAASAQSVAASGLSHLYLAWLWRFSTRRSNSLNFLA